MSSDRDHDSRPTYSAPLDVFDDDNDDLEYPLRAVTGGVHASMTPAAAPSRIGTAFERLTPAAPSPAQCAAGVRPLRPTTSAAAATPCQPRSRDRPFTAASQHRAVMSRIATTAFTGIPVPTPPPQHDAVRPGSLAVKPFLSRSTAVAVTHNRQYDFRAAFRRPLNQDLVIDAHRFMSLREQSPVPHGAADDTTQVDDEQLTPRERRAAAKVQEARARRELLESRLAVNIPTSIVATTPRSIVMSATVDVVAPVGDHSTALGRQLAHAKHELQKYAEANHFRLHHRTVRNDDTRAAYVRSESLRGFDEPFVAPDKLFQYRCSSDQIAAAIEDAEVAADRARPPRASRPATPRSVSTFFARGGHSDAEDAFVQQDEAYSDALRRAVKSAVHRNDRKLAKWDQIAAHQVVDTTKRAPTRPMSARTVAAAAKSSRPATARSVRPTMVSSACGFDSLDAPPGVSVHSWLKSLAAQQQRQPPS